MQVTTVGLDLAKHWFQVHGVDANRHVVVRRRARNQAAPVIRCARRAACRLPSRRGSPHSPPLLERHAGSTGPGQGWRRGRNRNGASDRKIVSLASRPFPYTVLHPVYQPKRDGFCVSPPCFARVCPSDTCTSCRLDLAGRRTTARFYRLRLFRSCIFWKNLHFIF